MNKRGEKQKAQFDLRFPDFTERTERDSFDELKCDRCDYWSSGDLATDGAWTLCSDCLDELLPEETET